MINWKYKIYILAFVEGLLLMSVELLASRFLTPHFGSTLYVITSILGITLLSLLTGYYIGSELVLRKVKVNTALIALILASFYLCLSPTIGAKIGTIGLSLGLITGSILGSLFLLFIPIVLLGLISPILVQVINDDGLIAGTSAGRIYTISTIGGFVGTFLTGLYLIPTFGTKMTALMIGCASFIFPAYLLTILGFKKGNLYLLVFMLVLFLTLGISSKPLPTPINSKVLYQSDDVLGLLQVLEYPNGSRVLKSNRTNQSVIDFESGVSYLLYTHAIAAIATGAIINKNAEILLIGMAGGSLVKELENSGYKNITVVDNDSRTKYIAENFFGVQPSSYSFLEADGRRYLNATDKKFDLIILDVSNAEQQPYHLFTKESFQKISDRLNEKGILIINLVDFLEETKAIITKRVLAGMNFAELNPVYFKDFYKPNSIPKTEMEYFAHEKILLGHKSAITMDQDTSTLNECCSWMPFAVNLRKNYPNCVQTINFKNQPPFNDDTPDMEVMSFERSKLLRTEFLK
ncbi:MAG: fused MFS/spermidine synthase [Saprospiraceae bacterium]|nr:fused MFS/spermidine synthase [Saprospiraceae bacterium]